MTEPSWASRNIILKDYDIETKTVLDFGCGDKSILNYLEFSSYLGIDKSSLADHIIDFNQPFEVPYTAEVGLVLGVLEYLDSPNNFIKTIKHTCSRFIIMVLTAKGPKTSQGWQRVYNKDTFNEFLSIHFDTFQVKQIGKYLIADIQNKKIS